MEFSVAAYRFGHSQIRPSYRANFGTSATDVTQQFFALVFDPGATDPGDPSDLRGGRRAPRRFIDWQTFFDFGDGRVRPNKKIDTKLSTVLFHLLGQPQGEPDSLATRNLLRNLTMKVPSGQRVARAMQLPELAAGDLDDLTAFDLHTRTPLWFSCCARRRSPPRANTWARWVAASWRRSSRPHRGDRLSYLRQDPDWTPTYGSADAFTMADLLTKSGTVATLT